MTSRQYKFANRDSSELSKEINLYIGNKLKSFEKITNYDHTMVRKYDGNGGTYIEYRCTITIENK